MSSNHARGVCNRCLKLGSALLAVFVASFTASASRHSPDAKAERFGIVYFRSDVPTCAVFKNPHVVKGSVVTLLPVDSKEKFKAAVGNPAPVPCGRDQPGSSYQLSLDHPLDFDVMGNAGMNAFGVAVLGNTPKQYFAHGCSSSEGVHVFVLSDTKPAREVVWHSYDYASYDTDPSCTDDDGQLIKAFEK